MEGRRERRKSIWMERKKEGYRDETKVGEKEECMDRRKEGGVLG